MRFGLDGGVDKGDSGDSGSSRVLWVFVGGICGAAGSSSLFLVSFGLLQVSSVAWNPSGLTIVSYSPLILTVSVLRSC